MARAKQASKQKRRKTVLPAWGAAGMSLAMAGGASAAVAPTANTPSHGVVPPPVITLGEEEISDVSLSTFYVFDKENAATPQVGEKVAWGCRCGGCRCGGCRCGWRGCGGCGGCGGCCLSWGYCRYC